MACGAITQKLLDKLPSPHPLSEVKRVYFSVKTWNKKNPRLDFFSPIRHNQPHC